MRYLLLCIISVAYVLPVQAIYDNKAIHEAFDQIGVALNHQDFASAKSHRERLLESVSIEDIAKNASYTDYLSLIQELWWDGRDEKFDNALIWREQYHPEDAKRASFLTRKNPSLFWESNCTSLYQASIDTIDYAHCVLQSSKVNSEKKKTILSSLIPRYFTKILKENNYQAMSDLSIFLSSYATNYPEKILLAEKYQKQLAKKILDHDSHWVNAYFVMLRIAKSNTERSYWINELKKNYIWDTERWKNTVEPSITYYQ